MKEVLVVFICTTESVNPQNHDSKQINLLLFIRSDLNYKGGKDDPNQRQKLFHHKDNEITVKDLWSIWAKSEVSITLVFI